MDRGSLNNVRIMQLSVIIPVFNAEKFVSEAVESALAQPETGEVILIEDGSLDDSLRVCQRLAAQHPEIRLIRHADEQNHGVAASRNLGINHAQFSLLAFLDADDFFLPGRFGTAKQVFDSNPNVDGVYEAIGVFFQDKKAVQKWGKRPYLTTMKKKVSPKNLFEKLAPLGKAGYWHIDGWTVKKTVFDRIGLFDEHLRLHEDTALFVKAAAFCTLVHGRLDVPVAIRRVHEGNLYLSPRPPKEIYKNRILMWRVLWEWSKRNLKRERRDRVLQRYLKFAGQPYEPNNSELNGIRSLCQLISEMVHDRHLALERLFQKQVQQVFLRGFIEPLSNRVRGV